MIQRQYLDFEGGGETIPPRELQNWHYQVRLGGVWLRVDYKGGGWISFHDQK